MPREREREKKKHLDDSIHLNDRSKQHRKRGIYKLARPCALKDLQPFLALKEQGKVTLMRATLGRASSRWGGKMEAWADTAEAQGLNLKS